MTNYIERYWRDATPADAIKEPPMVARFQNESWDYWEYGGWLVGWDRTDEYKWRSSGECYKHCQVYDAPDPGEGWRLIDHTEKPMPGDEHFVNNWGWCWCNEHISGIPYTDDLLLRRRIEQPKPEPKYVPFTWEDREQLRGRWICLGTSETQIQAFTNHDKFYINGICPEVLVRYWVFLDTGEPVGRKVTQ
jgi:hypothetical protein